MSPFFRLLKVILIISLQRCDALSRNADGNTALHVAAQSGNGWICWLLLERFGYRLMEECNKDGFTPLQLAELGTDYKWVFISHTHMSILRCFP
jgi:hypothetical protein